MIPEQLKDKRFKFIKIRPGTKKPYEEKWNEEANYRHNEPEFKKYMKTAKSYGVTCGYGNLIIVDIEHIEDKSLANLVIKNKFPETFTIQTGGGGWHLYYLCPDIKKRIRLSRDGKHYGEIQANGNQCIGPGSLHPNGNQYKIFNKINIATINKSELLKIVKDYVENEVSDNFTPINKSSLDWDISKLLEHCPELKTKDNNKYQGPHPIHGSSTGKNFEIDIEKNTWYCFRCGIGGDAIDLIMMLEKLVDFNEFCPTRDQFREKFLEAKKIGIEKYGFPNIEIGITNTKTKAKKLQKPKIFIKIGRGTKAKSKFNTVGIANYIEKKYNLIAIEEATGRKSYTYYYDKKEKYYKPDLEDKIVISEIHSFLGKMYWLPERENAILKYLKGVKYIEREKIEIPENLINVKNGIYNLETGKLERHSPKYYFLYKIPVNFDEKASCPKIEKFLREILPTIYLDFIQELFGYCLYSRYFKHGIFYCYGTGGNGKSVCLWLLQYMLGKSACSNKEIHRIAYDRFTSAQLYGKVCNISGELSKNMLKDTTMIKMLSAGDRISAEFKGKDSFEFENKAKIIISCNQITEANDHTPAWYDRQYIIPFLKKFRGSKEENPNLKYELVAKKELEGLLLWSISGLQRLYKNGKFSYPFENQKQRYLQILNSIDYFLNENYERTNNYHDIILNTEIYKKYIDYCKKHQIPPESHKELTRYLKGIGATIEIENIDERTVRNWHFLKQKVYL